MRLIVQHGKASHDIELDADAVEIRALQEALEARTGVMQRQQKLIFKGKVLLAHQTLQQAKLQDGAKVMLMASSGPTLGQAAAEALAREKAEAARQRAERERAAKERTAAREQRQAAKAAMSVMQERSALWRKTGIVALRDAGLTELPPEVSEAGTAAHIADLGGNRLATLPAEFGGLTAMQKLNLGRNLLESERLPAGLFSGFRQLSVLVLSHNRLAEVPAGICSLASLRTLDLSHNQISRLPAGIGSLGSLQHLSLDRNALEELPSSLGDCSSLQQLQAAHNRLSALPAQLSQLQSLRSLMLDGNRLKAVPPEVLLHCQQLHTLSLHGNPVTAEQLRDFPAFKEFDERRRAKYSKQLEMRVMFPTGGFDEGADETISRSAAEWRDRAM